MISLPFHRDCVLTCGCVLRLLKAGFSSGHMILLVLTATSVVTIPPHCPALNSCSLQCLHGFVRDDDGCYTCRCQVGEFLLATHCEFQLWNLSFKISLALNISLHIESVTDIIKKMAQNHERRHHNHPNTEAIQLLNYNGDSTGPRHWNCVSARSDPSSKRSIVLVEFAQEECANR
jgi:hypothetical protein